MRGGPIIDGRDRIRILADLLSHVPGYTPEWRPAPGTPGHALLSIFSRTIELEAQGLDQMPARARIAFLDALGNNLLPAQSARAPLVFTLMPTATLDVTLPARTQVAAKLPPPTPPLAGGPPPPPPPDPLFFIEQTVRLARARLAVAYSVDPDADTYHDHSVELAAGFTLFDELQPVPHAIYLGHGTQFKLSGTAEIILSFDLTAPRGLGASRPLLVEWEYLSADGWLPLQIVEDQTARLTADGRITLRTTGGPDAKEETLAGRKSYWIRGTVSARTPSARIGPLPGGWRLIPNAPLIDPSSLVGHVVTIDGQFRACVEGADPTTLVVSQPITGATGAQITDLTTGLPLAVLEKAEPGFQVPVENGSEFLAGDIVTVDDSARAAVTIVTRKMLELDGPVPGAAPGEYLVLADNLAPLRHEGADEAGTLPEIDVIRARVGFSKADLVPEAAYTDTAPLNVRNTFKPFGARPEKFTTFYVASKETFQRAGAQVALVFVLAQAGKGYDDAGVAGVDASHLDWAIEYFDGTTWSALDEEFELRDATTRLTVGGLTDPKGISFICPDDWSETEVNGEKNLWLRIRIDHGNYGHPLRLSVDTSSGTPKVVADPDTLAPPIVASLTLKYTYYTNSALPEHCLTFNDFAFEDHTEDARWPRRPFAPFVPVGDPTPAVHFGFTQKLPAGLVSLLAIARPANGDSPGVSPYVWEYFGARGWTELTVADETGGFARTGVFQFIGAPDAVKRDGLGGPLYRVRARLKPGARTTASRLGGLWLNGVWARQGESIANETVGVSNGNPSQTFVFPPQRIPVMPGETIEVREWSGRGDDWETAVLGVGPDDLRFEIDPRDGRTPTAVWVRWHVRPHLLSSGPNDRHYAIERANGVLHLGAPPFGMIPPAGARIVASYTSGGGLIGNVPAGTITELRSGISTVQSITNPLPASGGTATEGADAGRDRSTARLAHRDRAVSFTDYEWIAHEASPEVARARCLSLEGPPGSPLRGWVTLLIVPHSIDPAPQPTAELAARVLAAVRSRVPAGVAPRVRIVPPLYVAIGVDAEIVLRTLDDVGRVEAQVRDDLARYLHPLTGGRGDRGYRFGDAVYLSDFAALIEAIDGVDYVRRLQLNANGALQGDLVRLSPDALPAAGDHNLKLVVGGR